MRISLTPSTRQIGKGRARIQAPPPNNIFVVNEDCKKLDQEKVVEFHTIVENTLYATKRAISDTCKAIKFLTTRVQAPRKYDWDKLLHMM